MKFIIGLTGKKNSGKSTIAEYLHSTLSYEEYAFANPLKCGLIEIFGIKPESVYGTETQKNEIDPFWNISGRELAQVVGSELFRDYLPTLLPQLQNIWIRRMEKTLMLSLCKFILISDIRYPDEAEFVKSKNGILIRIERGETEQNDQHQSENQNILADYIVENNSTIDNLYKKIDSIMLELNWNV